MPRLCIIPARALSDDRIGPQELRTLAAIGYHTSLQGTGAWAANATMSERAKLEDRNFRRCVANLEAWGYVRRAARYREDGAQTSNTIELILDHQGEEGTPYPPRRVQDTPEGRVTGTPPGRVRDTPQTKAVERGQVNEVATHTPAMSFDDPSHQLAYLATLANAKHPAAIDATIRATLDGMHGAAYPPAIVGAALLELQAAGSTFSATGLRAFCRRLTASDPTAKPKAGNAGMFDRTESAIAAFLATTTQDHTNG